MNTLETLVNLVIFATLIQFVVEVVKKIIPSSAMKYIPIELINVIFGILLAISFKLDVFAMLGFTTENTIIAYIVTGLIISAGASPVYELIEKLKQSRQLTQNLNESTGDKNV